MKYLLYLFQINKYILMVNKDRFIVSPKAETFESFFAKYSQKYDYRYISNNPVKILDAPELNIDPELYIIDICNVTGKLAIVLSNYIYFWESNNNIDSIQTNNYGIDNILSIKWNNSGNILAYANNKSINFYNIKCKQVIYSIKINYKITNLSWKCDNILSVGNKESNIYTYDIIKKKIRTIKNTSFNSKYVQWADTGKLLSVYSKDRINIIDLNDNKIFENNMNITMFIWKPNSDKYFSIVNKNIIEFWDINYNKLKTFNYGYHITHLYWNISTKEILITDIKNNICLYDINFVNKKKEIKNDTQILDIFTINNSGILGCLCSNETIKLWEMFPIKKEKNNKKYLLEDNLLIR